MARISEKLEGNRKTTNYMGEPAYELLPKQKLVNLVATCMFNEPKYYGKVDKLILETCYTISKQDPEFILKLAAYTRNELHLRTISIILFVTAANIEEIKETGLIKKYAPFIIKRADEIYEAMACQLKLFGKPIPTRLKKALAKSFQSFDEYQLGKYNRKLDVTFKDVIMLTHPKEPSVLIKKILDDKLEIPYTWETAISKEGNKREVWDDLIKNKKLGYFATLRNLNNMLKVNISRWDDVISYITNENAIKKSQLLPVRFLSAYEAISDKSDGLFESSENNIKKLKNAVNNAIETAVKTNIPKIPGKTIIICDNSGSATGDSGGKSKLSLQSAQSMADVGNLMGLMVWYSCDDTIFGVFGDRLTMVRPDRSKGLLENFKSVKQSGGRVGPATEEGAFLMIEKMIKDKIFADRLIVCSDLQIGDGKDNEYGLDRKSGPERTIPKLIAKYRKEVNPNLKYYSISFNGCGTDVIDQDRILINGWSDNIFKFINTVETNQVKYIEEQFSYNNLIPKQIPVSTENDQ